MPKQSDKPLIKKTFTLWQEHDDYLTAEAKREFGSRSGILRRAIEADRKQTRRKRGEK